MNRFIDRVLASVFRKGRLEVTWPDGTAAHYGDGEGITAAIRFRDAAAVWQVLLNPMLALGETYMEGRTEFPGNGVVEFILLANQNWDRVSGIPWVAAGERAKFLVRRAVQNNNPWRARRNVAHHYDLGESLYRLFLDQDLQYSCAYFERPEESIDEAQLAKKRHIAAKLALRPGQRILDIGSGWGGLGLYLAEQAGADVTGVTLSTEQHRTSNERARARGLNGRVRFQLQDYRELEGTFDRIVSVGMFEHVGVPRYREYFQTCKRLMPPDGVMLLHSIGRSGPPGITNPFIAKYIFPGGYIPALSEVLPEIERAGLYVTDIEVLRLHYAETLKAWRTRFRARWDDAAALYDERFCRMWEFYLAGSEAAFRLGGMMVFQIQLTRKNDTLPITRDYMAVAEAALAHAPETSAALRIAGE